MNKRVSLWVCLLILFLFCFGQGAQMETLPVGDRVYEWVYDFIDQLYLRGYFQNLHLGTKPYFRGEIAISLLKLSQKIKNSKVYLSKPELWMIEKLKEEFASEMESIREGMDNPEPADNSIGLKLGVDLLECMQFQPREKSNFFESGLPYLGVEKKDDFSLFVRYSLDESLTTDSLYSGKVWQGMAGDVVQAYLGFKLPWFKLLLGRERLSWGQSKISSLILSEQVLPFDLIQIQGEWGVFKGNFFAAFLDPLTVKESFSEKKINRYLSGHRLSLNISKILELGLSETVIYGGENRGFEPYYLNPLIWYHGAQLNQNQDDNTFISFDFNLRPQKNISFYGEMLVDDYQIENNEPGDKEPNELALAGGFSLADFLSLEGYQINLEYQRINNWTYNQKSPWNRYLFKDRILGSRLGPDSDCFQGKILGWLRKGLKLELGYSITRNGEGNVFYLWEEPWLEVEGSYQEKFPTGVVEEVQEIKADFEYFYNHALRVKLTAAYAQLFNKGNIKGEDEDRFRIDLLIQYQFLQR